MSLKTMFTGRVRGFRIIEVVTFSVLVLLILGVYLGKTFAGRERAQIATVERQIGDEKARIRLLEAEVAHLEQPERLERLARQYLGLEPVPAKREASLSTLATLAPQPTPLAPKEEKAL